MERWHQSHFDKFLQDEENDLKLHFWEWKCLNLKEIGTRRRNLPRVDHLHQEGGHHKDKYLYKILQEPVKYPLVMKLRNIEKNRVKKTM
jgi:hypothetical protein